jgi:SulP family sulfate permease
MVGLMSGVLLLAISYSKAGRLIRYMPGTVIVGFTAGIAISIAFGQLNNFLGVIGTDPALEHFHQKLLDTTRHLDTVDGRTIIVGLIALLMLFSWVRLPIARIVPGPLLAVVSLTAVTWGFGIETATLGSRYGELPTSIPTPSLAFFDAALIVDLLPSAIAIAILASVESLLSAVVADGMARTAEKHDPDREIFGQGVANLVSPFMGGVPATAAIARTAAGIRSGGNSRIVGVVHSATVLSATVVLGSLASNVPIAVLAAILIFTAWNISDVPEVLALVKKAPRKDVIVLISTVLITVFFDLTYAIGFGVIASAFLLIHELMKVPAAKALVADEYGRVAEVSAELSALMQSRPDIAFFTVQGMLSFHSVAAFEYDLNADLSKPLILRMKDAGHIDASGLMTLKGVIEHRQRHGSRIILSAIQPDLMPLLERFGIIEAIGPGNVFPETRLAIASIAAPTDSKDSTELTQV